MLVLRLLLMAMTVIYLMDGHAEVLSSTTGIRSGGESPAMERNKQEVQILDRKKKKPPKSKKKNKKKGKKPKPIKPKPKPAKPVTATPPIITSTLKTTTMSTAPTMKITATTTTATSPTTTATTNKSTTSTISPTASTTTTVATSSATTTEATTSTASTTTSVTITPTTTTTITAISSSSPTTAATTTDSGETGECKATNGKPCVFPFKDGTKAYNECKNHGGKYFWCATAVYDSGKYKYWSYCPKDGSCPLEGDGECRAVNNKPCVFPFKDGEKEYNECADFGGKYFWCATGTNSVGKYTSWSKCPKDGACPLSRKTTAPVTTPTVTTTVTTLLTNETSPTASAIANVENTLNQINDTLQNLETADFTEDEKQLLETMTDLNNYLTSSSQTRSYYDPMKINYWSQQLYSTTENIKAKNQISSGFYSTFQDKQTTCSNSAQDAKLSEVQTGNGRMFFLSTVTKVGTVTGVSCPLSCCSKCKDIAASSQLFEYFRKYNECDCYKAKSGIVPKTMFADNIDSGICDSTNILTRENIILNCPAKNPETNNAPLLYRTKVEIDGEDEWWFEVNNPEECAEKCSASFNCEAFAVSKCSFCQFLTYRDPSPNLERLKASNYCLRSCNEVQDEHKFSKTNGCSCGDEKTICPEGSFCNSMNTFCIQGKCDKDWLDKYQGYQPIPPENGPTNRIIGPSADNLDIVSDWTVWPWMAYISIHTSKIHTLRKFCGGVLVSCQHVITALHCLLNKKKVPYPAEKIDVYLGSKKVFKGKKFTSMEYWYKKNDQGGIDFHSVQVEDEDGQVTYKDSPINDIAVIKLYRPIEPSPLHKEYFNPIRLPDEKMNPADYFGEKKSWIAGWGFKDFDHQTGKYIRTDQLVQTNMFPMVSPDICQQQSQFQKDRNICAGPGRYRTCKGDSGSPIMVKKDGYWYLLGINSLSFGKCYEETKTGQYMNVIHYLDDILRFIKYGT